MLKGVDPVLTGELLLRLDRMGHSDSIVVSDAHFPAYRLGPPVVESAASVSRMVQALLTVVELDDVGPVALMESGAAWNAVQHEIVEASGVGADAVATLAREDFYARAASAQLIVRTVDTRTFANVVLAKGVTPGGSTVQA